MPQPTNPFALTLILIGAIMGFGRDMLTDLYLKLHFRLWKRAPNPRLRIALRLYLVFTSMIFTIMGILGLVGIIKF